MNSRRRIRFGVAAAIFLVLGANAASAQELKIGKTYTKNYPAAVLGWYLNDRCKVLSAEDAHTYKMALEYLDAEFRPFYLDQKIHEVYGAMKKVASDTKKFPCTDKTLPDGIKKLETMTIELGRSWAKEHGKLYDFQAYMGFDTAPDRSTENPDKQK